MLVIVLICMQVLTNFGFFGGNKLNWNHIVMIDIIICAYEKNFSVVINWLKNWNKVYFPCSVMINNKRTTAAHIMSVLECVLCIEAISMLMTFVWLWLSSLLFDIIFNMFYHWTRMHWGVVVWVLEYFRYVIEGLLLISAAGGTSCGCRYAHVGRPLMLKMKMRLCPNRGQCCCHGGGVYWLLTWHYTTLVLTLYSWCPRDESVTAPSTAQHIT